MSLVLRGVRPYGEEAVDLVVADGLIVEVAPAGTGDGRVLDADGLVALPGFVDLHTHLREPGREDAETVLSGSQAAALGGFTSVHAMANTDPVADTAGTVEQVLRLGQEAGYVDVQPQIFDRTTVVQRGNPAGCQDALGRRDGRRPRRRRRPARMDIRFRESSVGHDQLRGPSDDRSARRTGAENLAGRLQSHRSEW